MKHYDFVEIGTALWGTLIELADEKTVGISVEPIKEYLDSLPNKPGVIKVPAAITDKPSGTIKIYYVTQGSISRYGLGGWLAGCNSVNKPHDFHTAYNDDPGYWLSCPEKKVQGRDLVAEGIVSCIDVPVLTFTELGVKYDIGQVDFIKIDTEGHDPHILRSIMEYYAKVGKEFLPKKIQFENSRHSDSVFMKAMIEELQKLGYNVINVVNDSVATL